MNSRRHAGSYEGKIAGLYDLEETIGKGHFAVVKLAKHVFTGEKVAVKVIDKTKLDEISKAHLFQEVRCMKLVQHPNVVRLYEVIDTQTKLYLILELGDGGDMYDYIMKHDSGLSENDARSYFRQIVQAINYCHQLHVVHRDLKPENVVFFEKAGVVKLTDFGFSNKFIPGSKLETSCGSLAYSAPEILLGDSYDAPAVDVWSLGVILFMLVCGTPPFQEANDSETLTMIMDCKYRLPSHITKECKDLIGKMLVREPNRRAALKEILQHQWLNKGDSQLPVMPLICRGSLTSDDHNYILQKMFEGKIASKEEIIRALEKDSYNHITATYFLLAERRLRRQQDLASYQQQFSVGHRRDSDTKPSLAPLALSPRVQSADSSQKPHRPQLDSLVSPPGLQIAQQTTDVQSNKHRRSNSPADRPFLSRPCSLIQEECIEEDEEEELERRSQKSARSNRSKSSGLSVSHKVSQEDSLSDSDSYHSSSERNESPRRTGSAASTSRGGRPLHSVKSSPHLLNQIFEEGESEEDDIGSLHKRSSPRGYYRNLTSPDIVRKFDSIARKKRITSNQRGTSCSSSDASDTDETDSKKRKEKLKTRFPRRDSDHSSDTDGPSGPCGPRGGGRPAGSGGSNHDGRSHDRGAKKEDNNSRKSGDQKSGGRQQNGMHPSKRDSLTSITSSVSDPGNCEMGRRISNMSMASSNLSNVSLSSLNSRGSKYAVPDSSPSKKQSLPTLKDVETLNKENKDKSKIIHVRSKEFCDLVDKFKPAAKDDGKSKEFLRMRRRPKDKMKMDINRNGLIAHADENLTDSEVEKQQNLARTKCCSLV